MKINYAQSTRLRGGGIGNIAYRAACELERHGMLQRVYCGSYNPSELPEEKIRPFGLPNRALRKMAMYDETGLVHYIQAQLFDRWVARQLDPADIYHGWCLDALHSLQVAHQRGMKTILEHPSSHPRHQARILKAEAARWGIPWKAHEPTLRRYDREIMETDYILVPSDYAYRSFIDWGVEAHKLVTIPFGVDLKQFHPVAKEAKRPFRVLFTGQIGLRKGIPYLLKAWERLRWQDAELWLVGRYDPHIQARFARELRLRGVIQYGYVPDPSACFANADLFVFPTLDEGSALVTYEAMASGLPVITTAHCGALCEEGREGYIVPLRDVAALAERMQYLRDHPGQRRAMGQAARRKIESHSWAHYGCGLAQIYQDI